MIKVIHISPMIPITHDTYRQSKGITYDTYSVQTGITHDTLTRFYILRTR